MSWISRAWRKENLRKRDTNEIDPQAPLGEISDSVIPEANEDMNKSKNRLSVDQQSVDCEPVLTKPNNTFENVSWHGKLLQVVKMFMKFVGPGLMVAVAYMDPGNYSTDVSSGSKFEYKMLFVILLSTIIALYLQILSIRLGSITGRDLAENCHDHLHPYLSWFIWFLAEGAIMSTDVAEVAGTAIALYVLGKVPLMAGVFISIVDVFLVMLAYGRETGVQALRIMEAVVTVFILVVVVSFCVLLGKIPKENVGHVLYGYVPSSVLVSAEGILSAAGILGATVMPHSLYLGSAQAIPRIRDFDFRNGYLSETREKSQSIENYRPSVLAVNSTIRYSVTELVLALISVAFFVNSAILIVAGDTLYNTDNNSATLFDLNTTLQKYLGNGLAIVFFIALLFSGLSAGVICTISGQIVSEGHIRWKTKPWIRRLVTRVVTLIPCVIVVACLGKEGISAALNWSQVVLTITLPFLATPLVYLTSLKKVMTVKVRRYNSNGEDDVFGINEGKDLSNGWISMIFGILVCTFLTVANVYNLVQIGITGHT